MHYVYDGFVYTQRIYIRYSLLLLSRRFNYESHAAALFREVPPMTISLGVWVMSILITASLSASLGFLLAACLHQGGDSCQDHFRNS